MSAGSPTRPSAETAAACAQPSSVACRNSWVLSVSTNPGATEFTVMPRAPSTFDRSRENTSSAPLVIAYAMFPGMTADRARPDEMLMTRPPSRIRSAPCFTRKNGAFTFTAKTLSYSSSSMSSIGRVFPIPALFTRMSSPSACRSNSVQRACVSPGRPSSTPIANAEPPAASIAVTVSFAARSFLP